jgi:hypothetical protein
VFTTTTVPEAPIVLKADGENTTAPFQLKGGNYKSTWQTFGPGDCYHSANLYPGSVSLMSAEGITSGETFVPNIKAGEYYVKVITGPVPRCRWQITLTRAA